MIFSKKLLFSNGQAVTATAVSTNVIDLGATGTVPYSPAALKANVGNGASVPVDIQVVEAFAGITSLQVEFQVAADEAFTSPTVVAVTPAVPVASLVAGYKFVIDKIPVGTNKRYMRLNYVVAGGPGSAGKITAGIVAAVQTNDTVPAAA
jgi:hypothetical protein